MTTFKRISEKTRRESSTRLDSFPSETRLRPIERVSSETCSLIDSLMALCRNDINATDPMGQTALFATVAAGRFDLFKTLIDDYKADRKVVDIKGVNLYHWAKEHEDETKPETLKFAKLIKKLDTAEEAAAAAAERKKKMEAAFLKEARKQQQYLVQQRRR